MSRESMMNKLGLKKQDFEPKKESLVVEITREDFNLLHVEEDGVIYHILEEDGAVTIKKGVNR